MAQARLKVTINRLVRFAHTAGTRNRIKAIKLINIFINPGFPKSVPGALKPVIVTPIDGIITHGTKHITIIKTEKREPK